MEFRSMNRRSITEEIIEHVKELILTRQLQEGDLLPTEEQMAEQMSVGRGSIRESFRVLIHLGLIERQGKKTMVAPLSYERLKNEAVFNSMERHRDVMEPVELRKVIEPEVAGLAAERAEESDIDEISQVFQGMVDAQGVAEDFMVHDTRFHTAIMRAAGNDLFVEIMDNIQQLLQKNRLLVAEQHRQILPRSIESHRKILAAIKARNRKLAKRHMLDHLLDVEKAMVQLFEEEES